MMDRKEFIKTCGYTCLGALGLSNFLNSCKTVYVNTSAENGKLKVMRSEFIEVKDGKTKVRDYVIVRTPNPSYGSPIVLYRRSDTDFTALLMQCTHQGVELTVNGNILSCSAHGSEFNDKGSVITGPADQNLTQYPVTTDAENIYIQLT